MKRKIPETNLNPDLCEFLLEISEHEWHSNRRMHKSQAYKRAAEVLRMHDAEIKSGQEARKLEGIGPKIELKIDEFLGTGRVQKAVNKMMKFEPGAYNFQPATANNLRLDDVTSFRRTVEPPKKEQGSHTVALNARGFLATGLREAQENSKKKANNGSKQRLNSTNTKKDEMKKHVDLDINQLKRHNGKTEDEDSQLGIPRKEIEHFDELLTESIMLLDPAYKYTICGSFRREEPTSREISVLLTHSTYRSSDSHRNQFLHQVVEHLKDEKLIVDTLSAGDSKFIGVCSYPAEKSSSEIKSRRIDIKLVPSDQYFCALLYFTGSDSFNKRMKSHAVDKGFLINDHCIRFQGITGVPGESLPVSSERDIFDYIDFPYHEPRQRSA